MKKRWKALGVLLGSGGLAVYGISLYVFRSFFVRWPKERVESMKTRYYGKLEQGELADRVADIKEGMAWIRGQKHEDVNLLSFDGLNLHARFYMNPSDTNATIMLCHGYHSNGEHDFGAAFTYYWELGYNLLLIDQRAHGDSEGTYICFGCKERNDVLSWSKWLVLRLGQDTKIILGGISMGATSVLLAAALPTLPSNVIGCIADCGFTSPYDEFLHIAKETLKVPAFPFLPVVELICKHRAGFGFRELSTVSELAHVKIPILFVHGEGDTFVLPENTRRNYEAYQGRKELILVPDAEHGLSYLVDTKQCQEGIKRFLESL